MGIDNSNDMRRAQDILGNLKGQNVTVKRVKKDNGLIERASMDDNKVILTEDNRQILLG